MGARRRLRPRLQRNERRRLVDAAAQPQPEGDEPDAQQERDPPSPRIELARRQRVGDRSDDSGAGYGAEGRAHLREGSVASALLLRAVLHGQQHRARPFAADRRALREAEHHEQQRTPHAEHRVRRQESHQAGGGAHQQQRRDENESAPAPIAQVAEHEAAERPREIADGVGREGQQRSGERIERREEDAAEHERGEHVVDGEVVPLEGGPDGARGRESSHARSRSRTA